MSIKAWLFWNTIMLVCVGMGSGNWYLAGAAVAAGYILMPVSV